MRDVLFRGKSVLTGEWLYGSLINNAFFKSNDGTPVPYILDTDKIIYDDFMDIGEQLDDFEVIPESVGQYTGLKDKNGEEIFEGDVVSTEDGCFEGTTFGVVTEYKGMFTSFYGQDALGRERYDELHTVSGEREVIGNIYENPELLEESK